MIEGKDQKVIDEEAKRLAESDYAHYAVESEDFVRKIIHWREESMVSQKVTVKNPTGLHLRPAGILCKEAMQFKSHITFRYRENTANAKSVLSVLGACIKSGDEIELVCEGEDEQEALAALVHAIENGLGE